MQISKSSIISGYDNFLDFSKPQFRQNIDWMNTMFVYILKLVNIIGSSTLLSFGVFQKIHWKIWHSCSIQMWNVLIKNFKFFDVVVRLDIRDVDLIVHVGCPKSVLSYWQEAGRCARDGRNGFSLILYDHFTLSLKTTGKDMANIVKNKDNKCIRKEIISLLSVGEVEKLDTNHCEGCDGPRCTCSPFSCCCVCSSKCKCQVDEDCLARYIHA